MEMEMAMETHICPLNYEYLFETEHHIIEIEFHLETLPR